MSYEQFLAEDRRLAVLRLLAEADGYDLNESILSDLLGRLGHQVSRDRLRTELAWLAEQGLVELEEYVGVKVARLTLRGADVAVGRTRVPGVKRPSPGG